MRRRRFLAATAGTALGASLAGCSALLESSDGGTDGDGPPYDRFVPADLAETPIRVGATLDYAAVHEAEDGALWPNASPEDHDPLVYLPASLSHGVGIGGAFLADEAGLTRLVEEGGPTDRMHVGGAQVLEGTYDAERIADDLEEAGFSEGESYRGFDIYESTAAEPVVAIEDDLVAFGIDDETVDVSPTDALEATIDTARGDRPRASEEVPACADLGEAAPTRDFVGVHYDGTGALFEPNEEDDSSIQIVYPPAGIGIEGEALGYAVAFDVTGEVETTFHLAIRYANADAVGGTDEIREAVAPSAADPSVSVDGPVAVVEATYERASGS